MYGIKWTYLIGSGKYHEDWDNNCFIKNKDIFQYKKCMDLFTEDKKLQIAYYFIFIGILLPLSFHGTNILLNTYKFKTKKNIRK